ncbi:UDP-N-acetylmuramoyl-tripeptide--D-alanyl-D-alanine ligase [Fuerstiella marisgermanici]|uniref:UDP-N-acetylmuramoyl-tripeptide--D-alanyl-D-alanine ligase n=1 Tax=Fuerstiella marisgermanici TaxID=1891926 RepID=A0A1P8WBB1_9PLAN|nr:UDP-N-acetylmuramoyl-tripeptide--D-alanyl-D-alanine ligase [Fuerstiella marisgermanici]APZ91339.1 UDP-N-acetylmuramoyl-tripeptide--D-alanyl-D-alanine ligase [Fuerstiella marisgermanici]
MWHLQVVFSHTAVDDKAELVMHPLTVKQICELTDGVIVGQVAPGAIIEGCVIDSRDVQPGDAFFAIQGTQQHGVSFATTALSAGANVVIVDEAVSADCLTPHIAVDDIEIALAQVAHANRRRSEALVVGITGSVGKTTARSLISCVLQTVHTGIESPRNFNNCLGVPLSLLELQEGDEFAAIEIGASGPGEVQALSAIAEPEFAVVTRIAPAHLHGFKSLNTVRAEKQQLVASIPADGVAFLNADDSAVAAMASATKARVVSFGLSESANVRATEVESENGQLSLTVDGFRFHVPVCGRHNVTNVLAAIAVGMEIGVTPELINAGLQTFQPQHGRCVVSQVGDWTVIDDTYNSSPASVAAAIQTVSEFTDNRHRIVVLSDMLDLGDQASDLHYGIGATLARSAVDHVVLTGQFADDVVEGFLSSGGNINRISQFASRALLLEILECLVGPGDVVLFKGSRATAMERVIEELRQRLAPPQSVTRKAA